MTRFWMIWNPAGRPPSFRHLSQEAARTEAERLARQSPGQEFYVLEAIDSAIVPQPPVIWASREEERRPDELVPDDIPF